MSFTRRRRSLVEHNVRGKDSFNTRILSGHYIHIIYDNDIEFVKYTV